MVIGMVQPMRTAVARIVVLAMMYLGVANAPLAAEELVVAVPQLPVFKGVPYGRPYGGNPEAFTIPAIFEGLTYIDAKGQVQPQLATAWEQVSDNHWQFQLRSGVQFSNGAPFNANTVVRNLSFVREEQSAAYSVVQQLAHVTRIVASARHTIDVFTSRADPFMPQLVSVFYMVEPEQWERLGQAGFGGEPVGTGPHQVREWRDTAVELERAESARRQARTSRLTILEVSQPTTRLQGLLAGDLDVVFSMGPDDRDIIEAQGHSMYTRATPGVITLPFNLTVDAPLRDVRVRWALNHAVDNATIVKAILGEGAVTPTQFTSSMAFGYDPEYEPYPYDPDRARALLAEAGYGDGFDLSAEVTQGLSSYSASIYQLVASYLANVGVRMNIRSIPVARYMEILMQGQWGNSLATNLDYAVDPTLDALVPIQRHSCSGAIAWYCDPGITPLLAAAYSTADPVERLALTKRVVRRQSEQAPGLLLWEKIRYDAVSEGVEGFTHDLNFVHYDRLKRRLRR